MPNAVIYVPLSGSPAQRQRWRDLGAQACQRRRYRIVAVVSVWADAELMKRSGRAGVVVAALPEHFPADREPRDEAATDPDVHLAVVPPTQRRTRRQT